MQIHNPEIRNLVSMLFTYVADTTPFPLSPELTSIVIAYKNKKLIAEEVLPYVKVGKKTFEYNLLNKEDGFTVPRTVVGRKGRRNQVEFGATRTEASCVDHFLDDYIPQDDIDQAAGENFDPKARAVEMIMALIELDHEIEVAKLVFDADNYSATNKKALAAGEYFDAYDTSDPTATILASLDVCLMRPNVGVMGQNGWTKFRQHPKVVKAVHGNSGDAGVVTRKAVADLLELDDLLVGQGFVNTARKGQAPAFQRVWGNSMALIHRNDLADTENGVTFGFTARFKERESREGFDSKVGARGSVVVTAGQTTKPLITAPDLGFLITNILEP